MNSGGLQISSTENGRAAAAPTPNAVKEEQGYLQHQGTQLYYALHAPVATPRGHVLLVGPFGSERHATYIPWVRWARFLAHHGYEAMRFDFRGIGESGGSFEHMTFSGWMDDVRFCANWLTARAAGRRVILNGLECGGLLAHRAFTEGKGSALLVWSPPASARDMLLDGLRQKLFIDYTSRKGARRMVREDYIKELEGGRCVEVGGNLWSRDLWNDASQFALPDVNAASTPTRPCKVVQLDPSTEPLVAGPNKWRLLNPPVDVRPLPLNTNLEACFTQNLAWINALPGLT